METSIEFVYILVQDNDWENMIVFLSKEAAVKESLLKADARIEVFKKNNNGYKPTYNYYRNGTYVPSIC